jgi:hypothetical protein
MTKKDYIEIARIINTQPFTDPQDKVNLAHAFASMLARDNARFDRARFLAACGVK